MSKFPKGEGRQLPHQRPQPNTHIIGAMQQPPMKEIKTTSTTEANIGIIMQDNITNDLQAIAIELNLAIAAIYNNGSAFSLELTNHYTIEIAKISGVDKYQVSLSDFPPTGNCVEMTAHKDSLRMVIEFLVAYAAEYDEKVVQSELGALAA